MSALTLWLYIEIQQVGLYSRSARKRHIYDAQTLKRCRESQTEEGFVQLLPHIITRAHMLRAQ